jgi:cytochrome d ubiquinol oxidase subunit II
MGPVWEANHVWLIFLIVLLFTCFPGAFSALSIALFIPFHLILVGIILRGAAFVFRAHGPMPPNVFSGWEHAFGSASVFTPVLLGACLGAISNGQLRVRGSLPLPGSEWAWLDPLALAIGVLALALCAYLAATYLTLETSGELREDFRRRALGAWFATGLWSIGTLLLTYSEAPRLWEGLTSARAGPVVIAGILLAPASGLAMWRRHFRWARALGVGQIVLLIVGWALAQWPYLIAPDVVLADAAAPPAILQFVLWTLIPGLGLLIPSLWLLVSVFKGGILAAMRDPHESPSGIGSSPG